MAGDPGTITIGAIGVAIGGFITGLWAWFTQRTKGQSETEIAVLAEWSKLNSGLSARLTEVERDCAQMRRDHADEIDKMRKAHAEEMEAMRLAHGNEMEAMRRTHAAEIDEMRTKLRSERQRREGLERQFAQNSQSSAALIGPLTRDDKGSGK